MDRYSALESFLSAGRQMCGPSVIDDSCALQIELAFHKIGIAELLCRLNTFSMNTDTQPEIAPPAPNDLHVEATLDDELEKYRLLEELEKLFLASKRHHLKAAALLPAHC